MEQQIKCGLRTSIELSSIGVGNYTRHLYYPKRNSVIEPSEANDSMECFPLLTMIEGLNILWNLHFSVAIIMSRRFIWIKDEVEELEFRVEMEENFDLYNEADLIGQILIKMVKSRLIDVEIINLWLLSETKKHYDSLTPKVEQNGNPNQ